MRIADAAGERGERRDRRLHDVAASDVGVPGHRPDHEIVALPGDAGKLGNALKIDERGRGRKALLHGRQQGHAAGQRFGVGVGEIGDGGGERLRAMIFKGVHCRILPNEA